MDKQIVDIAPEQAVLVKELHNRMAVGYEFPDIGGPLFAVRKMITDEHGEAQAAAALKLVGEAFLWINPDDDDFSKTANIVRLAQACHEHAKALQLEDVSAWIPPHIEAQFGNMLLRMGWTRSPWASWSARIKP